MTGYGETGPFASHSSYGPILEAYGGFDEATGYVGGGPIRVGIALPDAVGGLHGAYALLAALWEREHVEGAVHVDMSQLETLLSFAGEELLATSVTGAAPVRHGNRSADHAPQGVYPCAGDDAWLALTVTSDAGWRALVELVGDEQLAGLAAADVDARRRHHDVIDAALAAWTTDRCAGEAASTLQALGVAACPAFTNADLVHDAHLHARGFIAEWDQPDVGPRRYPGFPVHFQDLDIELRPAPTLGQHNVEILETLGYTAAERAELALAGTTATEPPP